MLNQLVQTFLRIRDERTAVYILQFCLISSVYHIGISLGKYFNKLFPNSYELMDEYALCYYFTQQHRKCYNIYSSLLSLKNLTHDLSKRALFNAHFCINHITDDYSYYDEDKVRKISQRSSQAFPVITVSVTTCKRMDLFQQTINSFINCCKDIDMVDKWICVDDNSSEKDRAKMKELYPFFEFYFKTPEEKGHPQSMNIIRRIVDTPYLFHMEDDWKFFEKRKYLTDCLEILQQDDNIGQCLINRNYAETERDITIAGGLFEVTNSGLRYFRHEFSNNQNELNNFRNKYGTGVSQCTYWPYFSFRPSLIKTKIFNEIGEFNEKVSHFEMDYCSRYTNQKYVSVFLEGIYSIHIGRLTSERNDKSKPNAYELNNEAQFEGKEEKITTYTLPPPPPKSNPDNTPLSDEFDSVQVLSLEHNLPETFPKMETFVVNLDRRPDRMREFQENAKTILDFLGYYNRYSAVDGMKLETNPQLQRIFDGNDYNMRKGMVGCAMSHIDLYVQLVNSDDTDMYMILEDDITFTKDFKKKLMFVLKQLNDVDWDMIYLGHHLREQYISNSSYNQDLMPHIEKWDALTSLQRSLGGTGGYIITKDGARRLLNFIDKHGMTNGIDTVQQKSADDLDVYYASPHLILTECWRGKNNVDTDIQYDYDSLTKSVPDRLNEEKEFYSRIGREFITSNELVIIPGDRKVYYLTDLQPNDLVTVVRYCIEKGIPYYTLNDEVLIIVPTPDEYVRQNRYFSRVKKGDIYSVADAITYTD